ncbi:hypothetical protein TRAPUB_3562 [Trametes pubescens]|uniref:Uncharacterized protein n=1 Tax=Trametes pubescens TaxID=154538 RepID=A0A1M2VDF2_TRAPU|nr:hypothetical protein TRAPUB_3562 [Trametes pubescens]
MLAAVDDLDVVSFVIGVLALLIALGVPVMHLVWRRLPPGRLNQIDEALAEARAHLQLLVDSGKIANKKAETMLLSLAK